MAPTDATEKGDSVTELTDYCLVIPNGTKHSQQEKQTVNGVKVIKLML